MNQVRNGRLLALLCLFSAGCQGDGDGLTSSVVQKSFAPVAPLTPVQIDAIVAAAATATDAPNLSIAVVDRIGNLLRLYQRGISATFGPTPDITTILPVEDRAPLNFATSLARTAAYLSHSQAPLTSRTGQFLSTFHFPAVFAREDFLTTPPDAFAANLPAHGATFPLQRTLGIANTAQAPLWQIDASIRGTGFESGATLPPTAYVVPGLLPLLANPDGSTPSPGLGPLPGGMPLYTRSALDGAFDVPRRLVGAIGVFITDTGGAPLPDLAEFAAFSGSSAVNPTPFMGLAENFTFGPDAVPNTGGIFLNGVLLPYLFLSLPAGAGITGLYDPADEIAPFAALDALTGSIDPEGFLIAPQSSVDPDVADPLSAAEVTSLLARVLEASSATHAAIRLPSDSPCKMVVAVCDRDGVLLGVSRQEDATLFSVEVSISKARNAVFFSDPNSRWTTDVLEAGVLAGRHPLTGFRPLPDPAGGFLPVIDADGQLIDANGAIVDVFPPGVLTSSGVAITARTLGFLTQPFYPPGIDGSNVAGPLTHLVQKNRHPLSFEGQGFAARAGSGDPNEPAYADTQSGILFFPGSAPLYRDGVLVGGIGVSGDGVEQDDFVTFRGIQLAQELLGFTLEPPTSLRADRFAFEGVGLPYFKFPQNPGG